MAGWLVVVETERLGGGSPLRQIYAVAEPDQTNALTIVAQTAQTTDERAIAWTPISQDFLDVFDVEQGRCLIVQAVS